MIFSMWTNHLFCTGSQKMYDLISGVGILFTLLPPFMYTFLLKRLSHPLPPDVLVVFLTASEV